MYPTQPISLIYLIRSGPCLYLTQSDTIRGGYRAIWDFYLRDGYGYGWIHCHRFLKMKEILLGVIRHEKFIVIQ